MTTEHEAEETNTFEAFEAEAKGEAPAEKAPAEEAKEPAKDDAEVKDDAPADDDAPEAKDDEHKDEKRRSKPAHKRIAEITAQKHEAERRASEAEARLAALEKGEKPPAEAAADAPVAPDPEAYELGEFDPQYLADLVEHKVKTQLAAASVEQAANAEKQRIADMATTLDTQWSEKAAKAVEKYPDFETVVLESAAAGEWDCPPIMAMAIQASDVGDDIAYHLATHKDEAKTLAELAHSDPFEAVRQFGRLEERLGSKPAAAAAKMTDAPDPPEHRSRGAGGKFEVGADTSDFAAFEAKVKANAG